MFATLLVLVVIVVIAVAFAKSRSGGAAAGASLPRPPSSPPASSPAKPRPGAEDDDEEVTEETLAVTGGKPFLKAISGPGKLETYFLSKTGTTSLGRASDNDIVFTEEAASGKHCIIEKLGNSYLLSDVGSTNKTWVNGVEQSQVELRNGDQIRVGDTTLVFGLHGDR